MRGTGGITRRRFWRCASGWAGNKALSGGGGGRGGKRCNQLGRLFKQHPGFAAAAEESHPALLPEFGQRERPRLRARRDAVTHATVADRLHGRNHLGVLKIAGDAQRNREVHGSNHYGVQSGHAQEFISHLHGLLRLDLKNHQGVGVYVRQNFGDRCALVVHVRRRETETADAFWRELGPAHRLPQQLDRLNARENHAHSAAIQRSRDQIIFHVGYAHDGAQAAIRGCAAHVLNGFDVECAVLGVDEGPVKPGGGEDARNFRRTQLREPRAQLNASLGQSLFDGIDSHEMMSVTKSRWSGDPDSSSEHCRKDARPDQIRAWRRTEGSCTNVPANVFEDTGGPPETSFPAWLDRCAAALRARFWLPFLRTDTRSLTGSGQGRLSEWDQRRRARG